MKGVSQPIMAVIFLAGAGYCGSFPLRASQEVSPASGTAKPNSAAPAATPVDPRYRSPRATARTFLIAMNRIEDDPSQIEEAKACLDLSGIADKVRTGGRLAHQLEFVLRSTNVPTIVIPDEEAGSECEVGESKDTKLTLHRQEDGRWLFSGQTLRDLARIRLFLWQRSVAASPAKNADVAADFRSPYAMVRKFIGAFKKNDLDAAAQCLDLSDVPSPARRLVGRQLAFKLKEVLDRTVFIIFQDLPDSSAGLPIEALVHKDGQITAERLADGPRKGQWLFNRATVHSVDPLYATFETEPILPELIAAGRSTGGPTFRYTPGLWLRHRLPGWLRYRIELGDQLSIAVYQLLGALVLLALALPVYRLATGLLDRLVRVLGRWRGVALPDEEVTAWARPVGWLAGIALLIEGVALLSLRLEPAAACASVLVPAYWLVLAFCVYQSITPILKLIAGPEIVQPGATSIAAMGFPVLSLVLKILVAVAGLAGLLTLFGFDVGTIIAGLGIGGLAVALAAQDTLKNFFGSLMLIADKTFRVGDLVQIGSNEGVVETVGLRSTRIRAADDSLMTVPNSDLTTAHITNFGARRFRRYRTQLNIAHGTTPLALERFREAIRDVIRAHPAARQDKYEVAVNDLGSSGIQLLIQVFFEVPDGHAELLARDRLILDVLRLAENHGIAFDSPTVFVERSQLESTQAPPA